MTVPRTESITMLSVEGLPRSIDVPAIASAAFSSAFTTIGAKLADAGYPCTGDIDPSEAAALERVFGLFVHALAVNNPTLCNPFRWAYPLTEERNGYDYISVEVEACEPDEIARDQGVRVEIIGQMETSSRCPIARLTGTREKVARLVFDGWAGPAGDLDWFTETMDEADVLYTADDLDTAWKQSGADDIDDPAVLAIARKIANDARASDNRAAIAKRIRGLGAEIADTLDTLAATLETDISETY